MPAHTALRVWQLLVMGLCTVGYVAWGPAEWLGVVQRVHLVRWHLGAAFRGGVWVHYRCQWWLLVCGAGRRCRLQCPLDRCTRRALMARRSLLLVPVHVGVCCAGGKPAGRCRLMGVVFLVCACVPLLTVYLLCSSCLCSGFFCATPDAYSALCLLLHCTAPLDVCNTISNGTA